MEVNEILDYQKHIMYLKSNSNHLWMPKHLKCIYDYLDCTSLGICII